MEEQKKFLKQKRNVVLIVVYALCVLALCGGAIMNATLHGRGELGDAVYRRRMIFILNSIGSMSLVILAELIFCIRFPAFLEIACVVFAFCCTGLATVYGFYTLIPVWDTVLHTVSGVLFGAVGLCLAHLLFKDKLSGLSKAAAYALFAFFFALAVGYLWEIYEFTLDSVNPENNLQEWSDSLIADLGDGTYLVSDRRGSGLIDTLTDMIVNCIGAFVLLLPVFFVILKKPNATEAFAVKIYPWWNKRLRKKKNDEETPSG